MCVYIVFSISSCAYSPLSFVYFINVDNCISCDAFQILFKKIFKYMYIKPKNNKIK